MRASLAIVLALAAVAASQSCSGPKYYNNLSFGISSGCIPTNYNSVGDLGNTNPNVAAVNCAQRCTALNNCGGWVAQLNKAGDSNLYSGSCFFYTSPPAQPRSCVDKPSQLIAGVRDDSVDCFSRSSAAATAFCSSYLSIRTSTFTVMAATPTATVFTTSTRTSSITSTTVTTTKTSTSTTVATVIQVTTVTTSDTTTPTISVTNTLTSVLTSTSTTIAATEILTRNVRRQASAAAPACLNSAVPASQLSADCSCLSIPSRTVTVTVTPASVTTRLSIFTTSRTSFSTTRISSLTSTIRVTATTLTTTSTSTTLSQPTTLSTLVTISTTTISVYSATTTACVPSYPPGNLLINPGFNDGTYNGWLNGGYGTYEKTIVADAYCGSSAARFFVNSVNSYARTGQRFNPQQGNAADASKQYRFQAYVKFAGGIPDSCQLYMSCVFPGSFNLADNPSLAVPLNQVPGQYTLYSVLCPANKAILETGIDLDCYGQPGPATMYIDELSLAPIN